MNRCSSFAILFGVMIVSGCNREKQCQEQPDTSPSLSASSKNTEGENAKNKTPPQTPCKSSDAPVPEPKIDRIAQATSLESATAERLFKRPPSSVEVIKYPDGELGVTINYVDKQNTPVTQNWCRTLMTGLKIYTNHWLMSRKEVKAVVLNWYEKDTFMFVNVLMTKATDAQSDWVTTSSKEIHKLFKQKFFHARMKMGCPEFFQ